MAYEPRRWGWGLIPLACLALAAGSCVSGRIEAGLAERARAALGAALIGRLTIEAQGRDLTISGEIPDAATLADALSRLGEIDGVRVLRTPDLKLAPKAAQLDPPAPMPTPTLTPTPAPAEIELTPPLPAPAPLALTSDLLTTTPTPDAPPPPEPTPTPAEVTPDNFPAVVSDLASGRPRLVAADCRREFDREMGQSGIDFERNSPYPSLQSYSTIARLAALARLCRGVTIEIAGSVERRGRWGEPRRLAAARADYIARMFVLAGAPARRLRPTEDGTPAHGRIAFIIH